MDNQDRPSNYLPKVLRKSDWLILDISDKKCDSCGDYAEYHMWGILDYSGQTIIYCDITHAIRTTPVMNTNMGPNAGKIYV